MYTNTTEHRKLFHPDDNSNSLFVIQFIIILQNPHISEPMYVARARMNILMRDRTEGRLNNGRASHLIYLLLSSVDYKEKVTFLKYISRTNKHVKE